MLHIRSFRICFCFKRIILHHKFETSFYVSNSKNDDIIQLQSFIYYFKMQLQVKFQVMLPIHNDHNPNSKCQSTIQNCNFRLQFQFASSDGNFNESTQIIMPYFSPEDLTVSIIQIQNFILYFKFTTLDYIPNSKLQNILQSKNFSL